MRDSQRNDENVKCVQRIVSIFSMRNSEIDRETTNSTTHSRNSYKVMYSNLKFRLIFTGYHGLSQDFGSGKDFFEGLTRGEEVSKNFKKFLKKVAENEFFSIFFKNLTNHSLIFCALEGKTHC